MKNMRITNGQTLQAEFHDYDRFGISVMLKETPCSCEQLLEDMYVNEGFSYMRDYIFHSGEVCEVHFDKIPDKEKTPGNK